MPDNQLQKAGLQFEMRGFSQYLSGLKRLADQYARLGAQTEAAARRVARFQETSKSANTRLVNATIRLTSAYRSLRKVQDQIAAGERFLATQRSASVQNTKLIAKIEGFLEEKREKQQRLLDRAVIAQNNYDNAQRSAALSTENLSNAQKVLNSLMQASTSGTGKFAGAIGSVLAVVGKLAPVIAVASAAFVVLRGAINAVAGVVKFVVNTIKSAIDIIRKFASIAVNAFKGVLNILERLTRPLRDFIGRTLGVAAGMALYNWASRTREAIRALIEEIWDAVAAFQTLEIRMETLAARDYAQAFGTSMQEALEATAGSAQVLFDWMRKLAVQTPFSVERIASTYTMANAMGLMSGKAKELTTAIIDFTAGMGLTEDRMWNIVYNLGQMIQRGKLTGEEFRDLSRNFVPINQLLARMAERAGMSTEAFKALAMEGGVPVMEFLDEFVMWVEEDFVGAAERMARTWEGVQNNVHDFIQTFLGIDLLKPLMDDIAARLDDMLDSLVDNEVLQNSTKLLGQVLLHGFNQLVPAVDALVSALGELLSQFGITNEVISVTDETLDGASESFGKVYKIAQTLGTVFLTVFVIIKRQIDKLAESIRNFSSSGSVNIGDFVKNAIKWGTKFVESFAKGITLGLKAITAAIKAVSGILSFWFKPTSPPNIAPNIDKWGADTLAAWLDGFKEADFSVFDDITNLVESFFRSLPEEIGGLGIDKLVPGIMQMRVQIAQVLEHMRTGAISTAQAVSQIGQITAGASSQFKEYAAAIFAAAQAQHALDAASKKVAEAQANINQITEHYDDVIKGLRSQLEQVTTVYEEQTRLAEIENALATLTLTDEERARLEAEKSALLIKQQIRDVEAQRDAELDAAEAVLTEAEAQQAAAQEALATAEARVVAIRAQIEAQIEQNNLLQEHLRNLEKIKDETKENEEAIQEYVDLLSDFDQISINWEQTLDDMWKQAEEWADAWESLWESDEIKASMDDIKEAFKGVTGAGSELMDVLRNMIGAEEGESILTRIATAWEDFWQRIGKPEDVGVLDFISGKIEDFTQSFYNTIGPFIEPLQHFNATMVAFSESFWESMRLIAEAFRKTTPEDVEDSGFGTFIGTFVKESVMTLLDIFRGIMYNVAGAIRFFAEAINFLSDIWKNSKLSNIVETIADLIKVVMPGPVSLNRGKAFIDLMDNLTRFFTEGGWPESQKTAAQSWDEFIGGITAETERWYDLMVGRSIIPNMMDKIVETIYVAMETARTLWADKWRKMHDAVSIATRDMLNSLNGLGEGLSRIVSNFVNPVKSSMYQLATAIDKVTDNLGDLATQLSLIARGSINVKITYQGVLPQARQFGGDVLARMPYIVGEGGPELFMPNIPGRILPMSQALARQVAQNISAPSINLPPGYAASVDRSTHVNVAASYAQHKSEAGIYYDVVAALGAARR